MIEKRLFAVWPLGLALFLSSCGDPIPPRNAVINATEADRTTTYTNNNVPSVVTDGAIHFKVQVSPLDTSPVVGVTVELSGSSPSVGDTAAGFVSGGVIVNPADPSRITVTTDASGVVAATYRFTVPRCVANGTTTATAPDLKVTASISASIGGSTDTWTDNITITAC